MSGWRCHREAPLFSVRLAARYGFRPAVDLLFEGPDGRLVVVELEISRADPVANQVKFLLAHRAGELPDGTALVGMFSPAIARGRRAISGAFARHLRHDGVAAFQVSLLPQLDPGRIRELNRPADALASVALPVRRELARVASVIEPRGEREHRIHFAGDVTDVVANVWTWNDEVDVPAGAELWGQRRIQYFVHDPRSGEFAPSKFAAFIPAVKPGGPPLPLVGTMTLAIYATLGERDPRFDGHRARKHLTRHLAFEELPVAGSAFASAFERWLERRDGQVAPREPATILTPPRWFR